MAGSPLFIASPFSSTVGVILPVKKKKKLKAHKWNISIISHESYIYTTIITMEECGSGWLICIIF